jgi:hypothetical protein
MPTWWQPMLSDSRNDYWVGYQVHKLSALNFEEKKNQILILNFNFLD